MTYLLWVWYCSRADELFSLWKKKENIFYLVSWTCYAWKFKFWSSLSAHYITDKRKFIENVPDQNVDVFNTYSYLYSYWNINAYLLRYVLYSLSWFISSSLERTNVEHKSILTYIDAYSNFVRDFYIKKIGSVDHSTIK